MEREEVSQEQAIKLIAVLKQRFDSNMQRHPEIKWEDVQRRLEANTTKLWSLSQMEDTGGEPDVIHQDLNTEEFIFCDCSPESPKGRRSLCYDDEALNSRKEHKPVGSAVSMANEMGIEILNEKQYFELQKLGHFDTTTSSWLHTPADTRKHGGALFGDHRYNRTFTYHNGAQSYYAGRGFRGLLRV